ncbi:MAG: glycosyltransferase family 1 protein [Nostoc sp. LLA-1]|nr:glycosyltransferase family 1 protein [Cyanocohniella sp. LLY]
MLIQIIPQMPPVTSGVGDYALALARQFRRYFGIKTYFLVGDPDWTGATAIEDFPIKKVSERSPKALNAVLGEIVSPSATILLHYVGYGYATRGCPVWLVNGLQQWKMGISAGNLVTMFHEIYAARYPFWTSAFWTAPLQKRLAANLLNISDCVITNKPGYAEVLGKLCPGKQLKIPILPVFSSIGEPKKLLPLAERKHRLVVFGGSGNRAKVYQQSISALKSICRELDIQEVIDIGPPINLPIFEINNVPIFSLGLQPAEKVSAILQDSWAGFFNYPLDFLTRSTIFAAYCAHGVIPIGTNYYAWGKEEDGLEINKHYWLIDSQTKELSFAVGETIAKNAYNWYQTHNLSRQAKIFADIIKNTTV